MGTVVGVAVVAPWAVGDGYLLLLDWVSGPTQTLTPGVYGLSGSALDAMPFRVGTAVLRNIVGSAATAWLLLLAYFPLAAAGVAMAARGSRWRVWSAAVFIVANPFVVDRVRAGHVALLLGAALLPWLFNSAVHAREQSKRFAVRPAVWYALAVSVSPHAAWLGAAVLVWVMLTPRPSGRDILRTAQVLASAALVYLYALVLWLTGTRTLEVTGADLSAYATASGPGGITATVLSLHGFWRDWPQQVRDDLPSVLALLVLVVVVVAVSAGLTMLARQERARGLPLVALTLTGLLLGAGVSGPAAGLYRAAFDWLPLFEAMREQQKWVALAVLGYAVGFGVTVEALAAQRAAAVRVVAVATAALPLAVVGPSLIWGLGGTVRTSDYPDSWYAADRTMGDGEGLVLFLPWHGYQPFDFTDGRTVATPAEAFFSRRVLVSDAVELPELRTDSTSLRTAYVDRLVADGGADAFGRLLAPLGVEFVVLAKDRETDVYGWVLEQPGLDLVLDDENLALLRVVPRGTGRVVGAIVGDYDSAVAAAVDGELGSEAVLRPTPGTDELPRSPVGSQTSGSLERSGATSWDVAEGPAGWVVVPEEYAPGWMTSDDAAVPTVAGTLAVPVGPEETSIRYAPWRWLSVGLIVSVGVLVALVVGGLVEHRREIRALVGGGHRPPARMPRE